ncbi:hypothetical protein HPB47_018191 [Ixodes persulcatus]|uniref:Uncharacterized protein n=1 Tax=Ixodes persulcatus TaxID=34615 RepID=A0AC60QM64_IXOPE|nr:hypothetical protein HPB47_018191 [Ixodes persulcatus]
MACQVKTEQAVKTRGSDDDFIEFSHISTKVIGKSAFGVVQQIAMVDTKDVYALKWARQGHTNREVQIIRNFSHPNVTKLFYFCASSDNIIMEYVVDTMDRVILQYNRSKQTFPLFLIKLLIHPKFQNLLCDPDLWLVKLCDFGSAKFLVKGEPSVARICSRYYRAPELVLGATDYTTTVDVWSTGCVFAEFFISRPVFPGENSLVQLFAIIRILGTPTDDQLLRMNPEWPLRNARGWLPEMKPVPWKKVLEGKGSPEAIDLIVRLLDYVSSKRVSCFDVLAYVFFDDLRLPSARLPDGGSHPQLFNFSPVGHTGGRGRGPARP